MLDGALLTTVMPVALAIIMLGLGLSLAPADFAGVLRRPRAVTVALSAQVLLLPAACVGIAHLFALPPTLAVGLMLLAASPGGTVANLYSHLFGGDVALNVTLTAVNTLLAMVTLPIIVYLSMLHFMGSGTAIAMPLDKLLQVFGIVLAPVMLGMMLRWRQPALAGRLAMPVKILSAGFLIAIVAFAAISQWQTLLQYAKQVGGAALCFNLLSLTVGYHLPKLLGLGRRQAIAISMEVGIHNGALAIAIAMSPLLLNEPDMAIPSVVYGAIAFATAALFGLFMRGRAQRAPVGDAKDCNPVDRISA